LEDFVFKIDQLSFGHGVSLQANRQQIPKIAPQESAEMTMEHAMIEAFSIASNSWVSQAGCFLAGGHFLIKVMVRM
jgi:hypothetical protein